MTWMLVVIYIGYKTGAAIDHIPMQSREACLAADAQFDSSRWSPFCINQATGEIIWNPPKVEE
jgi:hypothetical protein